MKIHLKTGTLEILSNNREVLQSLTGFGSRHNKKRGFVFISKVLGKHYPVRPAVMESAYRQLATLINARLDVARPTMVIGFAETATALGYGVYQQLNLPHAFYIHTTRYQLNQPIWLNFQEEHCHAPTHLLYDVEDEQLRTLRDHAEQVVLIDDEFSTGRTLKNLVTQLRKKLPHVKTFIGASLLRWMPHSLPNITCVSLYQGQFQFSAKALTLPTVNQAIGQTEIALDTIIPYNFGRRGIQTPQFDYQHDINVQALQKQKVLVLGTGEFMYPAFLLGKFLEKQAVDVYVQATTRSPLNVDQDVTSKLTFVDNYYENIDNFLYNIKQYDQIIICYETTTLPDNHHLSRLLQPYTNKVTTLFMRPFNHS